MPVAPSPAAIDLAVSPAALDSIAPLIETAAATAPAVPVAIGVTGRGRGGSGGTGHDASVATPASDSSAPASSVGARGTGRSGRGLNGRGRWSGRGGQRVQSATASATGGDAVGAVAHLLGQASLQVPAGSSDAGAAAPATAAAPVALNRPPPPPPPATVTSLADADFSTGRPEPPESTIGGQSTCIICFTNPKTHAAGPRGDQWCARVRRLLGHLDQI